MLGKITIVEISSTLNRTLKRGGVGPLQEAWQCALTKDTNQPQLDGMVGSRNENG